MSSAHERKQTFHYNVDLLPDAQPETANDSKFVLPAAPGATYYRGSTSPDYPKRGKTDIVRANVATGEADAMIPDVLAPLLALIALAKLVLLCRISERITDAICRMLEKRPRRRRPRAPAPRKN